MSGSLLGAVTFFEPEELHALTLEFSDRLRRDPDLASVLARLVGNHWAAAETAFLSLLRSELFGEARPPVGLAELERAVGVLDLASIDRIVEVLLDSALYCLPLHSAARIDAVAEDIGRLLKSILLPEGVARDEMIASAFAKLSTGALHSSL